MTVPAPPRISLVGPPGAGKTAVGRALAARLGWAFVDTDAWVEERAGMSVAELFARRGEAAFRALEREAVAAALAGERVVIATGGGAVLDPESRARLLSSTFVACLEAPPAELLRRAAAAGLHRRPLLADGDPAEALARLLAQRAPAYAWCHARVDTAGRPPEAAAEDVAARWRRGLPWRRLELRFGAEASHPVWVGPGTWSRAGAWLADALGGLPPSGRPTLLVADAQVAAHHGALARCVLAAAGFAVHEAAVPPGEEHKTLATAARLYEEAAAARLERGDPVVALGGGVITDLTGFVAATYNRGVPWLALPTTLLAQVDAALGGKTGINLPAGKNLVGAFHPPRLVVCDTAPLATLPEREWRSGLAECVKHGAIADETYLRSLEDRAPDLARRDPDAVLDLVAGSVAIKARIVAADPRETGLRAVLNFGHTVGHALEAVAGYGALRHGEAVAVGMAVAADLSVALGLLAPRERDRLEELLVRLGLPVRLPPLEADALLAAAAWDKKRRGGRWRWVLLRRLGEAVLHDDVPLDLVRRALRHRGAR